MVLQLEELAGKLAADLEAKELKGKTLTLKLKATTFQVCAACAVVLLYTLLLAAARKVS